MILNSPKWTFLEFITPTATLNHQNSARAHQSLDAAQPPSKSTLSASRNNNSVSAESVLNQNNLSLGKTFRNNPLLDYAVAQEYKNCKEKKLTPTKLKTVTFIF